MKMKGLVVTTDNRMYVKEFDEPLYKTLGAVVGGWIEVVHPKRLKRPELMIVNEEGAIMTPPLPINATGSWLYGTDKHGYPIRGDLVIMANGFRDGEPDIVGLDDSTINDLIDRISIASNGGIQIVEASS